MVIVLSIYAAVIYIVFFWLNILPWSRPWKTIVGLLGLVITLVVVGALNVLTPSGSVVLKGATVEVTPNVSGMVVTVDVIPGVQVRKGDLLFKIDPTPFRLEVARLGAALVETQVAAARLQTDLEAAEAEVERLESQLRFGFKRRDDIVELADRGAAREFQRQEAISNIEQLQAGLRAAQAKKHGIEIRIAAKIDGLDASVVQAGAALDRAKWDLLQTEVIASTDGVVTALALRPGDRVTFTRSALALVPNDSRTLIGTFALNAANVVTVGHEVKVAMQSQPGSYFLTTVESIVPATSEGTLPLTGALPSISQFLGAQSFAVRLAVPEGVPEHTLRMGTSGTMTLISEDAGPMEPLANILFFIRQWTNYL